MTDFLENDYFKELSDVVIQDSQIRLERNKADDALVLFSTYRTERLHNLIADYGFDAVAVKEIEIYHDGSATLSGRNLYAAPTYFEFLDYVREGRC